MRAARCAMYVLVIIMGGNSMLDWLATIAILATGETPCCCNAHACLYATYAARIDTMLSVSESLPSPKEITYNMIMMLIDATRLFIYTPSHRLGRGASPTLTQEKPEGKNRVILSGLSCLSSSVLRQIWPMEVFAGATISTWVQIGVRCQHPQSAWCEWQNRVQQRAHVSIDRDQ